MPTEISKMKAIVKALMQTEYGRATVPAVASDEDIAGQYFVRAGDAAAIRDVCQRNLLTVSFREAGAHTLTRINAGNPCKGHTILDKSIKEKDGAYTYKGLSHDDFDKLKGLVGSPDHDGGLSGIWVVDRGAPAKKAPGEVRDLTTGFTGDYDMHDLLKKGARLLAGTPDEESAIEALNAAMLRPESESARLGHVTTETSAGGSGKKRLRESNYALIRHGAQTSYISYLLGAGSAELEEFKVQIPRDAIPDQDKIANISSKICVFDPEGKAYILGSVAQIYAYYAAKGLLDQVPFYFFFHDLKQRYAKNVGKWASEISDYLTNIYASG